MRCMDCREEIETFISYNGRTMWRHVDSGRMSCYPRKGLYAKTANPMYHADKLLNEVLTK